MNSDTDIMNVDYRVGILEVSEISDVHQFIEMEMMLDLTWLESRMVVDAEAEDWEENGLGEAGALEESITLAESLWLPDTQILMLKKIQSMAVTRKVGGFIVYRNKTVTYSKKYFFRNFVTVTQYSYSQNHLESSLQLYDEGLSFRQTLMSYSLSKL